MTNDRLKVTIVGAGLCGLAVGAHLRKFADVTILERASKLGTIGAGVVIGSNSHRILKNLGADLHGTGAVPMDSYQEWLTETDTLWVNRDIDSVAEAGIATVLAHRYDLQCELVRLATEEQPDCAPCKILFSQSVAHCDTETGTVTTLKGDTFTADVVIAADGIKSCCRRFVVGDKFRTSPSGHSAYRALLPREKVEAIPELKAMGLCDRRFTMVTGDRERRFVLYPTTHGNLLNLAAILPDNDLNEISEEKWSAQGNPDAMRKSYASFPKRWQDLLSIIDEIGLWQLRDQDPLENWVKGRTIVVGDAAHAMLPYLGQGASQAFEDAEALGAFLKGATRDTAPDALRKVFNVRYRRATWFQEMSRGSAPSEKMRKKYRSKLGEQVPDLDQPFDYMQYRNFMWDYFGAEDFARRKPEWVIQDKADKTDKQEKIIRQDNLAASRPVTVSAN